MIVRPLRVTICTITSCNTDTLARIHYVEVLITLDSSSLPWFPKIANLGSAVHHCKYISFCAEFPCHGQAPDMKTKTIGLSRSNVCVLALNALDTFRGWLALLRCPRPDYIMPPLLTTSPSSISSAVRGATYESYLTTTRPCTTVVVAHMQCQLLITSPRAKHATKPLF